MQHHHVMREEDKWGLVIWFCQLIWRQHACFSSWNCCTVWGSMRLLPRCTLPAAMCIEKMPGSFFGETAVNIWLIFWLVRRSPKHSRPDVSITHSSMSSYWLVTIKCKDRTKLLFDTVCTLADMDYDVFHATIDSVEGNAMQEYYIRPRLGKPGETQIIVLQTLNSLYTCNESLHLQQ